MRKAIVFFCLSLIINTVRSQTNVYHPFPDSNATWNVSYFQFSCPVPTTGEYTYYFGNDTMINNITYHSILKNGITYASCFNGNPLGYRAAIRQDTALKKVFVILAGDVIEHVLYDFNLNNIGDTLNMYCGMTCSYYHVTGIDSVLIDGSYRKRIWYDCTFWMNQTYWLIEGIGKSTGFLEECSEGFGVGTHLDCFTQNNQTLYPDSTTQCNLIDNTEDLIKGRDVLIFPNPSSGNITLQSTNQQFINSTITIFNSLGEIILKSEINNPKFEIDLSSYPAGIYFLKVDDGEKIAVKKIVKL